MAWCQILKFPGSTVAQYDAIAEEIGLPADPATWPKACISLVAGVTPDGLCVVDVWESAADFEAFRNARLGPAFGKIGGMPAPRVTSFTLHSSYGALGYRI